MVTIIRKGELTAAALERVARSLEQGGLACLPADTVYGLAGVPSSPVTQKIYDAKGREERKPLALVFNTVGQIIEMIPDLPRAVAEALGKLMPGPVTCIVPLTRPLPGGLEIHGASSAGVRIIPPPQGDIYRSLPSPLAVTSANMSGQPDPCAADEIPAGIAAACEYIVDAGRCEVGEPSTVVDLRPLAQGGGPVILREGPVSEGEIRRRLSRDE